MADDLALKIPLQGDTTGIESAMDTMKSKVSGAMAGVKDAMGAVGLMAAGFLKGAVESAVAASESTEQLKTKLENQGIAWSTASVQVDAFTKNVKAMSTFTSGDAKDALNNLITRNVSLTDAMKMQAPMTELAAAKNISLKDASNMLADAENGRWMGLEKLGVVTKAQVKSGIDMSTVLGTINDKYKGLSEGKMNSLPGQIDVMNRNWKDFTVGIGTALLPLITQVASIFEKLSTVLNNIGPGTKTIIADVLLATAVIGTLVGGLGIFQKVMGILGPITEGIGTAIEGMVLPIVAVIAAIALLTVAYTTNFGGFRTFVDGVIKDVIVIFQNLVTWFKANWPMIKDTFENVMTGIQTAYNTYLKPVVDFMLATLKQVVDWVVANWPLIQKTISTVMDAISSKIKLVLDVIKGLWDVFGGAITTIVITAFNIIKTTIDMVIKVVEDIIQIAMDLITGNWKGAWNGLVDIIKTVLGGAGKIIQDILDGIGKIFMDMATTAFDWGKNLIDGFIKGIESMAGAVATAAGNVVKSVASFMGFHSPSEKGEGQHIVEWGANMITGFMGGIKSQLPNLQALMNTAIKAPSLSSNVNMSVNGSSGSSGSSPISNANVFHVTIDAKNVQDFNSVVSLFNNLSQTANAN